MHPERDGMILHVSLTIPMLNLWRVLCVVPWNTLSLSADHRLSHLLDELNRLSLGMVELSELRRPDNSKTNSKQFITGPGWAMFTMSRGSNRHLSQTISLYSRGYSS